MTGILPGVAQAIEEIRCTFEGCGVEVEEDGSGGAFVVVIGISLGCPYTFTRVFSTRCLTTKGRMMKPGETWLTSCDMLAWGTLSNTV